jgi:hypothetical protein
MNLTAFLNKTQFLFLQTIPKIKTLEYLYSNIHIVRGGITA